ncbi:MAG: serine/threonine-protein phosphatase 6 regulatory ankyrin repeat subunit A-like [Rickettsiales bacterium]|jgi:serine/threonine-protein phosphatase 6 regulatory ankyrin repeat subunit B|nr:serine/threonine-protein phosphatase 6 regulatory ankyrin repeat subunit A-like [Rickettsiales bacterium]
MATLQEAVDILKDNQITEEERLAKITAALNETPDLVLKKTSKGVTLLHFAARHAKNKVIDVIVEKIKAVQPGDYKAKLETKAGNMGGTPMHWAAGSNNNEALISLKMHGANIEASDNKGKKPIHYAAGYGKVDVINLLKTLGAKLDSRDNKDATALHTAAENGQVKAVSLLINKGVSPDAANIYGQTALHKAVFRNSNEVIEVFTQQPNGKAGVFSRDANNQSPLHMAEAANYGEAVTLLQKAGFEYLNSLLENYAPAYIESIRPYFENISNLVTQTDKDGNTLLHLAVRYKWIELIPLLINQGADIKAKNSEGATALHAAVFSRNTQGAETLLKAGADKNAILREEKSVLAKVNETGTPGASIKATFKEAIAIIQDKNITEEERLAKITAALDETPDLVNQKALKGVTLLHFAAKYAKPPVINAIVEKIKAVQPDDYIAKIEAKAGNMGGTPVHWAAGSNNNEALISLKMHGANIEASDNKGKKPIHYAAGYGHVDIIELLKNIGAKIDSRDNKGATALHTAAENGRANAVFMLRYERANENKGFLQEAVNIKKQFALHRAAFRSNIKVITLLIETSNLMIRTLPDVNNQTPLDIAETANAGEVVTLLKEAEFRNLSRLLKYHKPGSIETIGRYFQGISKFVTQTDGDGATLLHFAAHYGCNELIPVIINQGADIEAKDFEGATVLHVAVSSGNLQGVEALLKAGANRNTKDFKGKTPLDYASENVKAQMREIFRNTKAAEITAPNF